MKITREQLKQIVGEVLQEEQDYQAYFQAMLKKHGVKSPAQFKTDQEKKAFFDKIEKGWKGVSERIDQIREEEAQKMAQLKEEEAQKLKEIEEANQKIDQAIEALNSLRPQAEEGYDHITKNDGYTKDQTEPSEYTNDGAGILQNEAFSDKKMSGKVIADRMRKHQMMKAFAGKVEKLKMVSANELDKMLPNYVDGALIQKLFTEK